MSANASGTDRHETEKAPAPPAGGDYVVCAGGPRDGAWYSAGFWAQTVAAAEHAGETAVEGRTLGYVATDDRQAHKALSGVIGRVASWNPGLASHRRNEPRPAPVSGKRPDPAERKCVFLGCGERPTKVLVPQYGRRWLLCDEHAGPAAATFSKFDNRQGMGSYLEPLS